ncbi:hypothetical protein [Micromonospora sp. NPDC048887]|uniref:hypothetical protein n=1 Tax=unclassified Micromonospora TaxID=2617518 RepID=UPI0033D90AD6
MSHRVLLGAAAVAALAVAAAVVVLATRDGDAGRPEPPGPVVATHNPSPGATDPAEYWTRERMRDAVGD